MYRLKEDGTLCLCYLLYFPDGREIVVRGECSGVIGFERDGNEGFGYDPLFWLTAKLSADIQQRKKIKSAIEVTHFAY